MYSDIIQCFETLPHGPFQAVATLVGEQQAKTLADGMHKELVLPDAFHNETEREAGPSAELNWRPNKRQRLMTFE